MLCVWNRGPDLKGVGGGQGEGPLGKELLKIGHISYFVCQDVVSLKDLLNGGFTLYSSSRIAVSGGRAVDPIPLWVPGHGKNIFVSF